MRGLKGRVAIVTGASKGLGRGIALRLAEEGVVQILCGRNQADLDRMVEEVRAKGGLVTPVICDVTRDEDIARLVETAAGINGTIDILVNNAAYMPGKAVPLEQNDDDFWDRNIDGGLTSAFKVMRAAFPYMKEKGGRIVNMTALGGLRGAKNAGAYGVGKTGIVGLTRIAANDWSQYGITVNCVAPMGYSDAWETYVESNAPGSNPFDALGIRRNTLGYAGNPEQDIAPAVAFLCSDDARYITGAILPVDGGLLDVE